MPFLSIITRCNNRPLGLYRNIESLAMQTCTDYEQVFGWDGQNRGVSWANDQLRVIGRRVRGDYVMVLDDDDMLNSPDAIATIREAAHDAPAMILWRMDHGDALGILPDDETWQQDPRQGHIGMSCWAVRRDVWMANLHEWRPRYEADYLWLAAVWYSLPDKRWIDRVLTACQNGRSVGAVEMEY